MPQELERISRVTQLATAGRFRRPGRVVTRDLRRKEALGLRNWLWIYNDALGMAVSLAFAAIFITVLTLWWSHTVAVVCGFLGVILSLASFIVSAILLYYRWPPPSRGHLTHEDRKLMVEGERSRRRAPHAKGRRARQPELEFNYKQYSVDVRYDKHKDAIVLKLLEHQPWKDNRYRSEVYKPTREEIAMVMVGNGREVAQLEAERWLYLSSQDAPDKVMADVYDYQGLMEALADALEQEAYKREENRLQHRRIALMARR